MSNRYFLLDKEVGQEIVGNIIKGIIEINKIDDENEENIVGYERKPIKLYIDTIGGSIYSGLSLIGAMDTSVTPIHTYCYGKAFSMGVPIFVAGHKRFAHRLATFMYHQVATGTMGKISDIETDVEECKRLQKIIDDFLLENSDIPKSKLEDSFHKKYDWYFDANQAKRYKMVDEILTSTRG